MATRRTTGIPSHLVGPAYAIAFLFVLFPIMDTLSQTWPAAVSNPAWRYGTIGIGANYLVSFLLGMLGLCALAAVGERRRTLRLFGVLCGIATVVLLVALLGFLLDAVQVRSGIPPSETQTRGAFDLGAAKAAVKYVLSAFVMGWLTIAAWRRGGAIARAQEQEPAMLIGERRK